MNVRDQALDNQWHIAYYKTWNPNEPFLLNVEISVWKHYIQKVLKIINSNSEYDFGWFKEMEAGTSCYPQKMFIWTKDNKLELDMDVLGINQKIYFLAVLTIEKNFYWGSDGINIPSMWSLSDD